MHRYFNPRAASFSLIEMLVVLILSSIVVGIIYVSFLTVSRYQLDLSKKYRKNDDVSSIYFLLQKDFERSERIKSTDPGTLRFTSALRPDIVYMFLDNAVIRNQFERVDTFHCQIEKPVFGLAGKIVETPGTIDELRLMIKSLPYPTNLVVYKRYDAAGLVTPIKSDTIQ